MESAAPGVILLSIFAGLALFIAVLSIAIDCARLLRRADKLIQLQEQQTRSLAAISTNLAKGSRTDSQARAGFETRAA